MSVSHIARLLRVPLLLALVAAPFAARALDPSRDWRTLASAHFAVHFAAEDEALARRALAVAERAHARLVPELDWEPRQRTHFTLTDHVDFANGWVTPLPFNHGELYLSPPDGPNLLEDFDDWLTLLITHEYTHVLHLDKATGLPATVRGVLGRNLFTFPQLFQPAFLVEGLATYHETDVERGVGRGQSALFAMMMRAELERGLMPFDRAQMTGLVEWPDGHVPYLYGVHFYQFLEARYGRATIDRLIRDYGDNLVPFLVNGNLRDNTGKSTPALWAEFEAWLRERYPRRAAPEVAGERLTTDGYRTSSPVAAGEAVYYVRADHRRRPTLMRRNAGGAVEALVELNEAARLDWHPAAGVVVAQPEVCDRYALYYDLYRYDPARDAFERLTHCGRYRFAAWSPDGTALAAVQTVGGRSRLVRLDARGANPATLWAADGDELLGQIDWSPDGATIVAARWRAGLGWDLAAFDVATRAWRGLTDDAAVETQPRFSADGTGVLYASDHGGKYDLRRLELATGDVATLSDVATGAFAPSEAADGDIYYLGYGPTGYDLFRLAADARLATSPPPSAPRAAAFVEPAAVVEAAEPRPYRPWSTLAPTSWWPLWFVTPDSTEFGATTYGQDALGLHAYVASLSHEFESGETAGALGYSYDLRYAVNLSRTLSHEVDDDGELERLARDDLAEVVATFPWLSVGRRFGAHLGAGYARFQDIEGLGTLAPRPSTTDALAGLALTWDDSDSLPRSVSRTAGREIRLIAESSDAFTSDFSGRVYTLDWREFVALPGEHVLALRYVRGHGEAGSRPFAFGGESPTQPDPLGVATGLFHQRDYPLRGYPEGLDRLVGERLALASAEWRFPIARIERAWRRPPFGVQQLAGSLFAERGKVEADGFAAERARGAGAELVADVNLFYFLNLRLRLGVARGFDEGGEDRAYLELGASF